MSTTERLESCPNCGHAQVGGARYCSQCGHEVADSDAEGASAADRDLAALRDRLAEALGSTLELGELVGRGGFGYVFSAWDPDLERRVAVKSLRADLAVWPGFLQRFRREAQVLASLSHDNIVEVFGFGEGQGVAYMVMPFLTGETLAGRMGERPLSATEAVPIMRGVARGLAAAHARSVIHRDVKPSNIMWDSDRDAWRVMDFGVAKVDTSGLTTLTTQASPMGTPLYMAPEQADDPRHADPRADIYAFGATFYHVLTGRPPFDGDSPMAVLVKHKIDPLTSPRSLNPDLPDYLNDCLERCLAKEPQDRFASFEEVLAILDSHEASAWDLPADPTVATSWAQYEQQRSRYLAKATPNAAVPDRYALPNGRVLSIHVGDLTDQEVDAVVSSDDNFLTMSGGVSGRIRIVGGAEVASDAGRFAPVRPGRVVVTPAGGLRARFVLHGVTLGFAPGAITPSRDLIAEIIDGCFYHADTFELRSLAFPLLGTGAGGFSKEVCLDTMVRVLLRKLVFQVSAVREARIVLFRPGA